MTPCVAHQAPLSIEPSRQEYWSGLPFPTPGEGGITDPGIKPESLASPALADRFFTNELLGTSKDQKRTLLNVACCSSTGELECS